MRTTLTLDDDVAAALRRVQKRLNRPFKDVVNQALRMGLPDLVKPETRRRRFTTTPVSLGRCAAPSLDDVAEVLAVVEGESFR